MIFNLSFFNPYNGKRAFSTRTNCKVRFYTSTKLQFFFLTKKKKLQFLFQPQH
ncbi:unnamed protein product [Arabidopsis halleri]